MEVGLGLLLSLSLSLLRVRSVSFALSLRFCEFCCCQRLFDFLMKKTESFYFQTFVFLPHASFWFFLSRPSHPPLPPFTSSPSILTTERR
mgnify:CR=1 FL=1